MLRYRIRGEPRQRFATLGEYPAVSPDAARTEANAIKTAARHGRDLLAERRAALAAEAPGAARRRAARPS